MEPKRMAHQLTGLVRVVTVCALILQTGTPPSAQVRTGTQPATPADQAQRALYLGQFDEVVRLLGTATDPRSVALRARADIERGHYAEADKALTPVAQAQPTSDAALELGILRLHLGQRPEGLRILRQIIDRLQPRTAAEYVRMGRAAQALGETQDANGFFRSANKMAPQDVEVNTTWGQLFLEKYDPKNALQSFQDALKADENHVPAILGFAELMLGENPPNAKPALEKALKLNPGSVRGHLMKAESALDDRRRDEAREEIKKALVVNPNSLEARSLSAAVAFLEGRPKAMDDEIKGSSRSTRITARSIASSAITPHAITASTRPPGWSSRPCRSIRTTPARMPISDATCCARETNRPHAPRSNAPSKTMTSIRSRTTC
jgi:tetratricopeptide (TPR) repeat protein